MPTAAENIQTALNGYSRKLAALADLQNVQGDEVFKLTYSENGRSMSWTEYQTFLIDKIESLQKLLQRLQGPYQIESRGVV